LEEWVEKSENRIQKFTLPYTQYSNIPLFQHSNVRCLRLEEREGRSRIHLNLKASHVMIVSHILQLRLQLRTMRPVLGASSL